MWVSVGPEGGKGSHLQLSNEKVDIRSLMFSILRKWSVLWGEFGGKGERISKEG
jgi:hypothetical protein